MAELFYYLNIMIPNFREFMAAFGTALLICGLLNAFFGCKMFNILLWIIGFLVGSVIGFALFLNYGSSSVSSGEMWIYVLVGGIIGGDLAGVVHGLGVFLAVGAMSTLVAFIMTQDSQFSLVVGFICGIVGAVLEKYAIIITTGLSGGSCAGMGIWLRSLANGEDKNVLVLGWVIGICGILVQLWLERDKPPEAERTPKAVRQPGAALGAGAAKAEEEVKKGGVVCCPECGTCFPDTAVFCIECGARLLKKPESVDSEWVCCPQCGTKLSKDANFCTNCGAARNK